jgi:hypothetical protein
MGRRTPALDEACRGESVIGHAESGSVHVEAAGRERFSGSPSLSPPSRPGRWLWD